VDSAVKWLQNGAQPTDTARAILSYKGALMKNHLAGGVRKGALTEEQAEAKFNEWLESKKGSIDHKKASLSEAKEKAKAEKLAAEKAVSEKRAADAAAAAAPAEEEATEEVEATAETATEEAPATEAQTEEAKEETPAAEEAKEDEKEA
jgi:small subunit ribosomal protein S16